MLILAALILVFPYALPQWWDNFSPPLTERYDRIDPDFILILELFMAGLKAGLSLPALLEILGQCTDDPSYVKISRALKNGVPLSVAWKHFRPTDPHFSRWVELLAPAWERGISPLDALAAEKNRVVSGRIEAARARAQEIGVKLVLPLGLCQLPAFILLGIAPIIISGFN